MTPDQVRTIAEALHNAPYEFLGVTPKTPQPMKSPPCVMIGNRTIGGFSEAANRAKQLWHDAPQYILAAGNVLMKTDSGEELGIRRIEDASQLAIYDH